MTTQTNTHHQETARTNNYGQPMITNQSPEEETGARSNQSRNEVLQTERESSPVPHYSYYTKSPGRVETTQHGTFNKNFNKNLGELYNQYPVSTKLYSGINPTTYSSQQDKNISRASGSFQYTQQAKSYSKDYINELKSMHEKEREELIHKNQAISNNLERLKSSFNDQVFLLQKQLTEAKTKSNNEILKLSEESEYNIRRMTDAFNDKEREQQEMISNLCSELKRVEEENQRVKNNHSDHAASAEEKIESLEENLSKKSKEHQDTVTFYKKQVEELKRGYSNDIENLVDKYESTLQKMSIDYEKKLNSKDNIIERQECRIADCERAFQQKEKMLEDFMTEKNAVVEQLKVEKYKLQRDLECCSVSKNNLILKLENLEKNENSLRQELMLKMKDQDVSIKDSQRLKFEVDVLREKERGAIQENSKLKALCENLQSNSDHQIREMSQLQEIIENLKRANIVLTDNNRNLECKCNELSQDLQSIYSQNDANKHNNHNLKNLTNQISSTLDQYKSNNQKLTSDFEHAMNEIRRLQSQMSEMNEEVSKSY